MASNILGNYYGVDPISMESVSAVTATNSVDLGTRRIHGGEEYVYFYNNTGSSVTAGMAMTVSGLSGYSLTRSTTAESDVAICFVKHAAVPAANYAWGLVRGIVQAQFTSTMATGVPIQIGTDGAVMTYTTAAASFPGAILGKVLSSATATSFGMCYVKCFG
jgi:hypothetical protein